MSLLEKNVAAATLVGGQQNSLSPPIAWFAARPPLGCRPHYAARYSTLHGKAGFFIFTGKRAFLFIFTGMRAFLFIPGGGPWMSKSYKV
jgi:hypothetical protein